MLSVWPTAAAPQSAIKDHTPRLTRESFSQPHATRPKTRWWLPLAPLQREELERELQHIADAGFGGVEILGTALTPSMPLEQYGFATPAWNQAMRDILLAAKARNLTVDFTIGGCTQPLRRRSNRMTWQRCRSSSTEAANPKESSMALCLSRSFRRRKVCRSVGWSE